MRRFKLSNLEGAVFDLGRTDAFFSAPSGLGEERSIGSAKTGDFAVVTDDELSLLPVSGKMIFAGYAQYAEFVDFLTDGLVLSYCPDDSADSPVWYYRDCRLKSLQKSEIGEGSPFLECPVTFQPLTPWYKPTVSYFSTVDAEAEKKQYDYEYPATYGSDQSGTVEIINRSRRRAPCKITIYGPCENPSWSCYRPGESFGDGAVAGSIADGEYIVIDANVLTMEIAKYDASGLRTNLYQSSDFSKARFISAPPGSSTFSISHSGDNALIAIIEVREYADTV